MKEQHDTNQAKPKMNSRRKFLKNVGIGSVGAVIGVSGVGSVLKLNDVEIGAKAQSASKSTRNFYGEHQAGISTIKQNHVYFVALDLKVKNKQELRELFKDWTKASEKMSQGLLLSENEGSGYTPPVDTAESRDLDPANLTITFGVGPTLFSKDGKDRFDLKAKQPKELNALPKFSLDALEPEWTGGDVCIQVASDDPQVNFHAVRNLIRISRGKAIVHWSQEGFQGTQKKSETPRNLFGFKDESINVNAEDPNALNQNVWVQPNQGPNWMTDGSYLVVRKVQMHIEVWDRTTLNDQENTFGRHRKSGAPLGKKHEMDPLELDRKDDSGEEIIPATAHVRRAHGKEKLYRRSYSYSNGMNMKTATLDAGLLFMCFQSKPSEQFIPIQKRLSQSDELNEYITHKGSGIFACLPGIQKGGYIGETLF